MEREVPLREQARAAVARLLECLRLRLGAGAACLRCAGTGAWQGGLDCPACGGTGRR